MVGDRAVGKTSLIQRYLRNHYASEYQGTLGAQMYPLEIEIPTEENELIIAKTAIFDLMGEHAVRDNFRDAMFYGTHGVLAVCDVARPETLYALTDWAQAVLAVSQGVPFVIALNKVDLSGKTAIGPKEATWIGERFPEAPVVMTSAKTAQGVEEVFSDLLNNATQYVLAKGRDRQLTGVTRHRILLFAARRGTMGFSKTELFANFSDAKPAGLMEELDNLVRLSLLLPDEPGAKSFVMSASLPGSFRYKITPLGQKVATNAALQDELVVDEPP